VSSYEAVLDGLSSLNKRLKEASSISLGYIKKFGIDPLGIVWRRFKDNALGAAAWIAKEAIKDWLSKRGFPFFNDWF
jgi:hypothetical protein